MKKKVMDLNSIKKVNRSVLLNILRDHGAMSRKDIAAISGLSPGAITIIATEMLNEGILKEAGLEERNGKAGRKKILLKIEKTHKFILGINIEKDTTTIAISDLNLTILSSKELATNANVMPENFLNEIIDNIKDLLWKLDISKGNILGIGVGIVGKVDPNTGKSMEAYGIWNKEVDLGGFLSKSLKLPVVVDNNVRSLAMAEINCSKRKNIDDFVFIKHGPGIGAAIVINKKLIYGSENQAGEIGHIIVNSDGPQCSCGQKGCLETVISTRRMKKTVQMAFDKSTTPILHRLCNGDKGKINTSLIFSAYENGDPYIKKIIDDNIKYMATGIINLMKTLDPQRIIFFGELFKYESLMKELINQIEQMLCKESIKNKIVTSCLEYKCKAIGPLALALERLFYETGAIYK
jgi:predicted NBD/HSP70 family sugar kinase